MYEPIRSERKKKSRERERERIELMECCGRPNRSDVHLSKEEEAKIEEATREHFDGLAPKRHSKPQRSEYSSNYTDTLFQEQDDGVIPEYLEFQHLENDSQVLVFLLN